MVKINESFACYVFLKKKEKQNKTFAVKYSIISGSDCITASVDIKPLKASELH